MLIASAVCSKHIAKPLAESLQVPFIEISIDYFADKEASIKLNGSFFGKKVILLYSLWPEPGEKIFQLLLIINAIKSSGAKKIIAALPYFAYSRQDKVWSAKQLLLDLLKVAGADKVITLDIHSGNHSNYCEQYLFNILPTKFFARFFEHITANLIFIAPDQGAKNRAAAMAKCLGVEYMALNKTRALSGECLINADCSDLSDKHCVLVDDVLASGKTILAAVEFLTHRGAEKIEVCVTHALMLEVDLLKHPAIKNFYTTDSIKLQLLHKKIHIIPSSTIILNTILALGDKFFSLQALSA